MITLITGTPGAGKSAYAVWHEIRTADAEGRLIYCCGIPRLKIPTVEWSYEQASKWAVKKPDVYDNETGELLPPLLENVKEGSLIVIDECQELWRNGSSSARDVPLDISYLEKHRHHGIDFVILTQHPDLVHSNVRRLVGKHIHIRKTPLGMYLYEFSEWCAHPETRGGRDNSSRRRYSLNKNVFQLYESASLHVKTSHRKPMQLYVLAVILILAPILGYFIYSRINKRVHPAALSASSVNSSGHSGISPSDISSPEIIKSSFMVVSPLSNLIDWSKVSSCVASASSCICYGQSSNKLIVPDSSCRIAVRTGWEAPKDTVSLNDNKSAAGLPTRKHDEAKDQPENSKPSINWEKNDVNTQDL
jgi:zona occludens toxin